MFEIIGVFVVFLAGVLGLGCLCYWAGLLNDKYNGYMPSPGRKRMIFARITLVVFAIIVFGGTLVQIIFALVN